MGPIADGTAHPPMTGRHRGLRYEGTHESDAAREGQRVNATADRYLTPRRTALKNREG